MASFARPTPPPRPHDEDGSAQALFHEIDAEVKAENFEKFLKKHGNAIAAAVIAVVLATAGISSWKNWMMHEQERETTALLGMMNNDASTLKDEELKAVMETYIRLGKEGHGEGIRLAAGVAEASALLQKGQKDAAVARLDALSKDNNLRPMYRDYAALQSVRMQMDEGDPQKLLTQLAPLMEDSSPWHLSATQLAAMLDAKAGHVDQAIAKLQKVIDAPDTPLAGREEAAQLLRLYKAM